MRDPLIEYIVSESNIERIANVTGFSKEGEGTRKGCAEQQLNQPDTTDVEGHFIKIFHLSCSCIRICAFALPVILRSLEERFGENEMFFALPGYIL